MLSTRRYAFRSELVPNQQRARREQGRLLERGARPRAEGPRRPFRRRRVAARRSEGSQAGALSVAVVSLPGERLGHHAIYRAAAVHEADQSPPGRHAGNEAFRSVDRVEHPDVLGVRTVRPVFFTDHSVGGKSLLDQPPHRRLRTAIGFRDRIERAASRLVLGADRAAEERQNHFARYLGEALHECCEIDRGHEKLPMKTPESHAETAYQLSRTPQAWRSRPLRNIVVTFCFSE